MHRVLVLACLLLAACAGGPTTFEPAQGKGDDGFRQHRAESGGWEVSVRGNTWTDAETVRELWLLRAAQLSLAEGAPAFVINGAARAPRIRPAFVMPQIGSGLGPTVNPPVRHEGYAPGVVPSKQLVAEGKLQLAASTDAAHAIDARRTCAELVPRYPGADCATRDQPIKK